ncbi:MATE family efflux transporter [Komagataeibacter oboediens]|uniref:MATE family efflux transporter n=1 Tax=Komagataeibacter oboediens TaxID=65958 RepID=A0ABS5SLE9_9PROT|nr:MATE family efflux transporter [Komagataeibacter oboediens]MBL7233542.1 MATE family efflux transporter [Komagataeibacter oboediens]MBT0675046.1 MATE family efflux transporter [Komagataeibacter oboediens]MBT0678417.1 MATE family efflux transporter [Komagataeibacter oboediens]
MTRSPHAFGTEFRSILAIAGPMGLSQFVQMLMGATDDVLLGGLGASALAIGGLATSTFFTLNAILAAMIEAGGILLSQARGRQDHASLGTIMTSMLAVALALCMPELFCLWHVDRLLAWMNEPEAIRAPVVHFVHILMWAVPPALLGQGIVTTALPVMGAQGILMRVMPCITVVNGVLNATLIHGWFGLPALGLYGSAIATVTTLWCMPFIMLAFVARRPDLRTVLRPRAHEWGHTLALLRTGLPMLAAAMAEVSLFQANSLEAARLGNSALAAFQIMLGIGVQCFVVYMALGQACNIRVGYWTGRGDPAMMRRAAWAAMLLGIAVAAVMTLGMALGRHAIISLYLNMSLPENTQAVSMALGLLLVGAAFQIPDAVQVITTGILRGQGDTAVPMVLAVIGYWGIGFPSGVYLAFRHGMGPSGLWCGNGIGLVAVFMMQGTRIVWRMRPRTARG